ncbi:hypothetical protein CLF_103444 [Clonorchis sinensis]|uniref:Uncharacterized protein n=1 Tax=Clonorchis sinensis TaxID=79923 RepID=G7Y9R6_CLOSI|nr:hypothetical protein CLF_103444 [Clonorchis sinensis]
MRNQKNGSGDAVELPRSGLKPKTTAEAVFDCPTYGQGHEKFSWFSLDVRSHGTHEKTGQGRLSKRDMNAHGWVSTLKLQSYCYKEVFLRLLLYCVPDVDTAVLVPCQNDRNEPLCALNGPKNTLDTCRSQFATIPWRILTSITTLNDSPKVFMYGAVHGPKYGFAMKNSMSCDVLEQVDTWNSIEYLRKVENDGIRCESFVFGLCWTIH